MLATTSISAMASVPAGEQSVSTSSIGRERASWGEIVLSWREKEYAYCTMKTYAGTAYYLYAKISGSDKLGPIPSSTNYGYNSSSTTTGKIFSRNTSSSVTWNASGKIKDTSTSGTQTASNNKTVY